MLYSFLNFLLSATSVILLIHLFYLGIMLPLTLKKNIKIITFNFFLIGFSKILIEIIPHRLTLFKIILIFLTIFLLLFLPFLIPFIKESFKDKKMPENKIFENEDIPLKNSDTNKILVIDNALEYLFLLNDKKLFFNANLLYTIKNDDLKFLYIKIKEEILDILVYMNRLNLGKISSVFVNKELNSIISFVNENYKDYVLIDEKLYSNDKERNQKIILKNANEILKKLKDINFKKDINIEKELKTTHIKNVIKNF